MTGSREDVAITGNASFPVNNGALCIKGWTAAATLAHPDRLLTPLVRNSAGKLAPATWNEALDLVARAFQDAQARYGRDAVGVSLVAALSPTRRHISWASSPG
jgi:assimilatory nitrate reductase catalytic subunit